MKRLKLVSLMVPDYDSAIQFYSGKLGFEVLEDLPFGEERWVTLAFPGNKDIAISLSRAKTDGDNALVGRQGGSFPLFGIETLDCAGDYRRLKGLAVEFDGERGRVDPIAHGRAQRTSGQHSEGSSVIDEADTVSRSARRRRTRGASRSYTSATSCRSYSSTTRRIWRGGSPPAPRDASSRSRRGPASSRAHSRRHCRVMYRSWRPTCSRR